MQIDTRSAINNFEVTRNKETDNTQLEICRSVLNEAFDGDFSEEDWSHTFGGIRFLGFLEKRLIAHGSVVPRTIWMDAIETKVGYVEGIAVEKSYWRRGFGSLLISEITAFCRAEYPISMLSTGEKEFYRKQGWVDFLGESYVKENGIEIRTKEEDEGLMVLLGALSSLSIPRKVVCETRDGDFW